MTCVSVIVPMYNVENYIGECLVSLRTQTLRDVQVVCVNDGSTDRTVERAREAVAGDERFLFVERENGGLSAARNTGLAHATGDYVSFLDSDDWYEPRTLEALYGRAVADDLDVVDFAARTVYESEEVRKVREEVFDARQPREGVYTGPDYFARCWEAHDYISSACFHLIRRELLEKADLRFLEGVVHEDELFTPLLYAHAQRVALMNEAFYCRRMRMDSIMTRPKTLANVRSLFVISRLLHAWIVEHADLYDAAFIDAFTWAIANIRDAAHVALRQVDEDDARAFMESLSAQDRLDFDLTVRFVSENAQNRYLDVAESRTYQLGNAIVAVPRAVRDRLKQAR